MRVVALVVVKQRYYVAAVVILAQLILKLDYLVALLNLDFSLYYYIVALFLSFLEHVLVVKLEYLRQALCACLALLVVFKVDRRQYDLPHRRAFGEYGAL